MERILKKNFRGTWLDWKIDTSDYTEKQFITQHVDVVCDLKEFEKQYGGKKLSVTLEAGSMDYACFVCHNIEPQYEDFALPEICFVPEDCDDNKPASKIQIGGDHYKHFKIQPFEFFMKNNIPFHKADIIKRILRFDLPGGKGKEDLEKIKHEVDMILEFD